MSKKEDSKLLFFDSYISAIENSVGSKSFQTLWAETDSGKKDILNKGQFSCAVYMTRILLWFDLVNEVHATVSGTVEDLKNCGWFEIEKPKRGCILEWEPKKQNGSENKHIGFYLGDEIAVSNSRNNRFPIKHHYKYGKVDSEPVRKIEKIYWHPKLEEKYF
ncbi:MAG: hypothetical protein ABEI53_03880 [Candidatus Magasanikbacteria bacterium]